MKFIALATLFSLFQVAIAAAPAEPILTTHERLVQVSSLVVESALEQPYTIVTNVTAYSSTPDQTDDTPFITAANTVVRDGIVAANFLDFGTKIQFPEMYGDKIFVVEDRMNKRYNNRIDIWFPDRDSAKQFGKRTMTVVILGA